MGEHSRLLSPSASHLWLHCTAYPQAVIDANLERSGGGEAADRGSLQHKYAEKAFLGQLDLLGDRPPDLTAEEWNEVGVAVNNAFKIKNTCSDKTLVFTERELKFKGWRAECFGTADIILVDTENKLLHVVDYKFGRTRVNVVTNPQLMIYAIIALELLGSKVEIERVFMSIIQPKITSGYQSFTATPAYLKDWDEKTLQPKQKAVLDGNGEFIIGPHCGEHYCKVNRAWKCEAQQQEADELADLYLNPDDTPVEQPNRENLSFFLRLMEREKALSDLMKAAFAVATEAAKDGAEIPGFKLVRGKKHKRFIDTEKADEFLRKKGVKKEDRYKSTLLTPSQAKDVLIRLNKLDTEKAIASFNELIETPLGELTLVPDTDPREGETTAGIDEAVGDLILDIMGGGKDDIDSLLADDDLDAFLDTIIQPKPSVEDDDLDAFLTTL